MEEQVKLTIICDKYFIADSLRKIANMVEDFDEEFDHYEDNHCDVEIDWEY